MLTRTLKENKLTPGTIKYALKKENEFVSDEPGPRIPSRRYPVHPHADLQPGQLGLRHDVLGNVGAVQPGPLHRQPTRLRQLRGQGVGLGLG